VLYSSMSYGSTRIICWECPKCKKRAASQLAHLCGQGGQRLSLLAAGFQPPNNQSDSRVNLSGLHIINDSTFNLS